MEHIKNKNSIRDLQVMNNKKLYKAVFNTSQDGIIFINKEGKIIDANPAALSILGINEDEPQLIYVQAYFSFHKVTNLRSEEIPKDQWPVERLLRNEKFEDEQLIVITKEDRQPLYLSFSGTPQTGQSGKFKTGILYIRDIGDNRDIENEDQVSFENSTQFKNALAHYKKQLKDERLLLQLIIDTIPVMVTIYNEKVDSIILNNAFINITGWTNEDVKKRNIMELAYPNPDYRNEVLEFMQSLNPGFKDIIMRTSDGRDIETSWANVKIPDGSQVGVGIDITERKRLENELISARKRAEKENQVQFAFIQNISHEVRTPMNSILGYTELLNKLVKGEKETEFIEAISYNGKQLMRLIDDIMDFSRLDKNELSLEKEEVSIKQVVDQLRRQFGIMKSTYKKAQLRFSVKSPHNLSKIMLYTDLYRLQQILNNLTSNAVKYTEKGTIELGVKVRKDHHDLLFYVKDSGIGIHKNDHTRVFNRFNRFHNTSKTEFRGTGLGLAICKHLVDLLGGKIWFESEPGIGSTFYFTHPFEDFQMRIETAGGENREINSELPDLTGCTLLIAEDDNFSYMLLYHLLADTHAEILHAETGKKAVELFKQNKIDLVFLDIRMPEMDGYEAIREIRKLNPTIPVIAQTANALPEDRKKIKRAGFTYHAGKPISQNELYSVLNRFVKRKD